MCSISTLSYHLYSKPRTVLTRLAFVPPVLYTSDSPHPPRVCCCCLCLCCAGDRRYLLRLILLHNSNATFKKIPPIFLAPLARETAGFEQKRPEVWLFRGSKPFLMTLELIRGRYGNPGQQRLWRHRESNVSSIMDRQHRVPGQQGLWRHWQSSPGCHSRGRCCGRCCGMGRGEQGGGGQFSMEEPWFLIKKSWFPIEKCWIYN